MSHEEKYSPVLERFAKFCEAWNIEVNSLPLWERTMMIQSYYLDVIASLMTELRHRPVILPPDLGLRN